MKKRILSIALSAVILAGSMNSLVHASPQKPFDWIGWLGNYTFDWSDDTTVEMRNGDGSDVLSVNGQYIIDHMLPGSCWPMAKDGGGLPDNVKTVSCQVVKEDAYIIMPFDGYVTIGIEDDNLAGDYGDICVRAKAGDKVNMVPRNLVAIYKNEALVRESYAGNTFLSASAKEQRIQSELRYAGTTADDWTYNLRIYKECFVPLNESKNGYTIPHENPELVSVPLCDANAFSCLWFIYQVDAPNTDIKAIELGQEAYELYDMYFGYGKYTHKPNSELNGWYEHPMQPGMQVYLENGKRVISGAGYGTGGGGTEGTTYTQVYGMYTAGRMTFENYSVFFDGKEINNIWNGLHMLPEYNIVNAESTPAEQQ
ncbi:MAG: hypothetical protein K2K74_07445 [Lachnospiraceae bacterium]|nr:hypothetical protein [Lachnospiraceae bacterium]